jgi:hypothetical protein
MSQHPDSRTGTAAGDPAGQTAGDAAADPLTGLADFTLERTGHAPLRFRGVLVSGADSSQWRGGPDKWYEAGLYRVKCGPAPDRDAAAAGHYVLHVGLRGANPMHQPEHWTAIVDSDPRAAVAAFDPLAGMHPWPDLPRYQTKQTSLERDLRAQWAQLASNLLRNFPEVI